MDKSLPSAPLPNDAGDPPRPKKSTVARKLGVLVVLVFIVVGIALFAHSRQAALGNTRRVYCMNNLHQISIALQLYAAAHGGLPPAHTTDADGKPLHSWRTLILPYLERSDLYRLVDLTKPWDDPANAEACKTALLVYECPSTTAGDNRTTYLAVVTPESCFRATEPRSLSEIPDTSRTLMVIEVDPEHAVPWMAPVDADEEVALGIGQEFKLSHPGGFNVAFADGHIRFLPAELPAAQRRALISIAGNDTAVLGGEY